MTKLTVIIPVYNAAKYITRAIESVLSQTIQDFELLIIDDGSTDSTAEIVHAYVASHSSQIRYVRQPNKGPAAARNLGIRESTAPLIAFLDSDDIWFPQKLETLLPYFARDPRLMLMYSNALFHDVVTGKETKQFVSAQNPLHIKKQLYIKNCMSTPTIIVRKQCLDDVGLFDESLAVGEDWDMWIRICTTYAFDYVHEPLVKIFVRPQSQSYFGTTNIDNEIRLLNNLYSKPPLKNRKWLKTRSFCYKYFAAAWAFYSQENYSSAEQYLCKAFVTNPIYFLSNKGMIVLLARLAARMLPFSKARKI